MKNDATRTGSCWRVAIVAATLLGACGPVTEEPAETQFLEVAEQEALTGVTLGMSLGSIDTAANKPLNVYAENAMCELSNMGSRWVRLVVNSPASSVDIPAYRRVVEKAKGTTVLGSTDKVKVLVTVPARYCGADNDQTQIDAFTTAYLDNLNALATNVFSGSAQVDAFEIGYEPNVTDTACPDGVSRFRVGPNAFAWLQRRAWQWKQSNSRPELFVSGGLFNTYTTTEPYWNSLFASAAFKSFPGVRPFDYFGVHPYNNAYIDTACVDQSLTTCFYNWKVKTADVDPPPNTNYPPTDPRSNPPPKGTGLGGVAVLVDKATGTTGSRLFATEFGFQLKICNTDNCVLNTYQQAAAYHAAGEALVNSGVTPLAIWNGYRDEGADRFGVRGDWDATNFTYTPRVATWNKFYTLAGGAGNSRPEACWATGSYFPMNFETSDARRTTATYEWVWAYRGECAPAERAVGLSKNPVTGGPRTVLCYKDPLDGARYTHIHPYPDPYDPRPGGDQEPEDNCTVLDIQAGSAGASATDWDPGNYKASCGPGRYVAGLANSTTTHKLTHVLCCAANVDPNAVSAQCSTVNFGSADNRETTTTGDWDTGGRKGECGINRYMAGVSVTPAGNPNALLCCNQ
jgi:hypothetical protein